MLAYLCFEHVLISSSAMQAVLSVTIYINILLSQASLPNTLKSDPRLSGSPHNLAISRTHLSKWKDPYLLQALLSLKREAQCISISASPPPTPRNLLINSRHWWPLQRSWELCFMVAGNSLTISTILVASIHTCKTFNFSFALLGEGF